MKSYYIMFYNNYEKICGCRKQARDEEHASLLAEFSLICHYPNALYDKIECSLISEE